jgi:hypothetical protein
MAKRKRSGAQRPKSRDMTRTEIHALFKDVENPKQRAFLAAYVKTKRTLAASQLTGVSREAHYNWLRHDVHYGDHWRRARKMLGDLVEEEVIRRAVDGYAKPVVHGGKVTDRYKNYSDRLAVFLLKHLKPEVYNVRQREPEIGGPTHINITVKRPDDPRREPATELPTITLPIPEKKE